MNTKRGSFGERIRTQSSILQTKKQWDETSRKPFLPSLQGLDHELEFKNLTKIETSRKISY